MTQHILRLPDGNTVPVENGMVLGRTQCDLALNDTKASRRHARIISESGVIEIEDLDSSNGTLLNGKPVTRKMMRVGDKLQIGRTVIVLEEGVATAPPPPAAAAPTVDPDDLLSSEPEVPAPARPAATAPRAPAPARSKPAPPPPDDDDDVDLFGDDDVEPAAATQPASVNPTPVRVSVPVPEQRDVLEFEDEVVEVVRQKPAPSPSSSSEEPLIQKRDQILQYSKKPNRGGALADDLGQMGGSQKALVVGLVLLGAVAIAYMVMDLTS